MDLSDTTNNSWDERGGGRMDASLDELIRFLLEEIALCGEQGKFKMLPYCLCNNNVAKNFFGRRYKIIVKHV